jgi:hypothetical protein
MAILDISSEAEAASCLLPRAVIKCCRVEKSKSNAVRQETKRKKKAKRYLVNSPAVHAPSTAKENDTRCRRAAKAALHTHPNIIQPHTAAPVGAHHAPRRTSCSVTDGPFGKPRHG